MQKKLTINIEDTTWDIFREEDLESLWENMTQEEFIEDERIPYWAEIWPASILLGKWILQNKTQLQNKTCLDVGCGLGLTSLIGASVGANIIAFDYEQKACDFTRENSIHSAHKILSPPLIICMDWRQPAFLPYSFDFIWAGDIFYEKRFFPVLENLFKTMLKPDGSVIIGEAARSISRPVWEDFQNTGWQVSTICTEKIAFESQNQTVHLRCLKKSLKELI